MLNVLYEKFSGKLFLRGNFKFYMLFVVIYKLVHVLIYLYVCAIWIVLCTGKQIGMWYVL
jgi:hypothetical protein